MEPLFVLHLRLESIGIVHRSVFSLEAYVALVEAVERGEFGLASIVELEGEHLEEAA